MANAINDGLNKPNQFPDDAVTTAIIKDDAVTTAKIIDDAVTVAKLGDLAKLFQSGSIEPEGASAEIVSFGTAFDTIPSVVMTVSESGTGNVAITGVSAGSFEYLGTSGIQYNWIATTL